MKNRTLEALLLNFSKKCELACNNRKIHLYSYYKI